MTVSLHDKWLFLGSVMEDPALPDTAKLVAYFLLDHLNTRTERCDPSLIGLAERMGVAKSTVIRATKKLEDAGYLSVDRRIGRTHRNGYRPNWEKVAPVTPFTKEEKVAPAHRKGSASAPEKVAPVLPETGNRNREETGKENSASEDSNLAPPEVSEKPTPARKKYAFAGTVIRLTVEDFETWANTYHGIPDIKAELTAIDAWCATNWAEGSSQRKGWFHRVSNMLNRKHQEAQTKTSTDSGDYWAAVEKGVIH